MSFKDKLGLFQREERVPDHEVRDTVKENLSENEYTATPWIKQYVKLVGRALKPQECVDVPQNILPYKNLKSLKRMVREINSRYAWSVSVKTYKEKWYRFTKLPSNSDIMDRLDLKLDEEWEMDTASRRDFYDHLANKVKREGVISIDNQRFAETLNFKSESSARNTVKKAMEHRDVDVRSHGTRLYFKERDDAV